MFAKRIKYDLKWLFKTIGLYWSICIVLAGLSAVFSHLPDSTFNSFLAGFCASASLALSIGALITSMIRTWSRQIRIFYKDEAYVTVTLPVSLTEIYNALLVSGILMILGCLIVAALCIWFSFGMSGPWFQETIRSLAGSMNLESGGFLCLFFGAVVCQMIYILLCGSLGIALGYQRNSSRFGWGFGYALAIYIVGVILLIGVIFGVCAATGNLSIFTEVNPSMDIFPVLLASIAILYALISLILYFVTVHQLNKGINAE